MQSYIHVPKLRERQILLHKSRNLYSIWLSKLSTSSALNNFFSPCEIRVFDTGSWVADVNLNAVMESDKSMIELNANIDHASQLKGKLTEELDAGVPLGPASSDRIWASAWELGGIQSS